MNKINLNAIKATASKTVKTVGKTLKKYLPEICIGGGAVAITAGTIGLCKKSPEISADMQERKQLETDILADCETEESEQKKEVRKVRFACARKIVKATWKPAALYLSGMCGVYAGTRLFRTRLTSAEGTIGNLTAVCATQANIIKSIKDNLGDNDAINAKFGLKDEVVTLEETDENGKTKKVKKKVKVADRDPLLNGYSDFARILDKSNCDIWYDDLDMMCTIISQIEDSLNEILKTRRDRHVFLNEAYRELGTKISKAGTVCGWRYDREYGKDNQIRITPVVYYDRENLKRHLIVDFNATQIVFNEENDAAGEVNLIDEY